MQFQVISGGQTGADQAALVAAKACGFVTGGYAPRGYRTETGVNLALKTEYGLLQHASSQYLPRTVSNVRLADGVVLFGNPHSAGSLATAQVMNANNKVGLYCSFPEIFQREAERLIIWLATIKPKILMVAGNRESVNPGIHAYVEALLIDAFMKVKEW